jgi:hypothetical protein
MHRANAIVADRQPLVADVIVRRRTKSVTSDWRDPDEMAQNVMQRILGYSQELVESVVVEFGYLELSKYEPQNWMRPVALVTFAALVRDGRNKWMATIAEPTTQIAEIDLLDGIGNWAI